MKKSEGPGMVGDPMVGTTVELLCRMDGVWEDGQGVTIPAGMLGVIIGMGDSGYLILIPVNCTCPDLSHLGMKIYVQAHPYLFVEI